MKSLIHPMNRECVNSLGIPVDNVSFQQALERIVAMAKNRDGRARFVSTLNVDFLVNSLGCFFSRPRHPELLNILRHSDMVTADGFPIVWLSKLVGAPLKARVTGADLVPALAERSAKEGLALFLLGGREGSASAAASTLKNTHPGLKIAGTAAPFIHTEGDDLVGFGKSDDELVHRINHSGADILLLGLGNPKQELWFNRNKHKLNVAVSIGVGGTFEFINGVTKRAPNWMQKTNLEWLYRITQDPARLWKRYVKGLMKLVILVLPLLFYRLKELLFYRQNDRFHQPDILWQSVWSSRHQSLAVLHLPSVLTASYLRRLIYSVEENTDTALRILDFSSVNHIQFSGLYEFIRLAEYFNDPENHISLFGMSGAVKRQLSACRIIDVITDSHLGDTLSTLSSGEPTQQISCKSYVMSDTTLIFLSGRVDSEGLAKLGFIESLEHAVRGRTCILDLRNVTLLESSAIATLHDFFDSELEEKEGAVLISGMSANVRQMFYMTALGESVLFINDKTLLALIAEEGAVYDENIVSEEIQMNEQDLANEQEIIGKEGATHE